MAPSILGVENIGFVTIAPHKHIVFIFFLFLLFCSLLFCANCVFYAK